VFSGDIMSHKQNYEPKPYSLMYAGVEAILQKADLSFGNLEFPIHEDRPYSDYPLFNVHADYVQAVIDAGFNVFSLANNHSADQGLSGIKSTQNQMNLLLEKARSQGKQIWYNGLRDFSEKDNPAYSLSLIEYKTWKIGFIALSEFVNIPSLSRGLQILPVKEGKKQDAFLAWLKEQRQKCDLLIVSVHWGIEYASKPSEYQKTLAKKLSEAGADIIWGNHPHVLQAWSKAKTSRGDALLMYSLGNFISAQAWYIQPGMETKAIARKGDSLLFRVDVKKTDQGKLEFSRLEPIMIAHRRMDDGNLTVQLYSQLIRLSSKAWRPYFRKRFDILSKEIDASEEASLSWDEYGERKRYIPE